ncbi:coagulation factor V [Neoarius graeffei]|uniref:coagulation factor V n=1 Tax=Neoarius graeffei TaxID=443677 RepID=UPI00298C3FB6|nr:coagulation factor V [Neoarius graeffei]
MRFLLWPVVLGLLSFLSQCTEAVERHYYIAAVNINWDYTTNGTPSKGPIYRKTVYREYDPGFNTVKTTPWSGLLGPTLRGQVGDTIIVTFRNMANHSCSIHPHGIAYGKQSEGALYFDNTSQFEKEDDVIFPGKEHTYYWEVTQDVAPKDADPPCVTYTYFSHHDIVKDYNTGLIGALLICKKGSLDESGKQVNFHQEFTLLFGVFDESNTWYSKRDAPLKNDVKYTINGFTNGSVPDLNVCAHSKVTWHLVGMNSEPELFSVHFNGQVLQQSGHKVSSIGIMSGTATSADMVAIYPGRWLLSSHINKHLEAGMHGFLLVNTCEKFPAPKRRLTIKQQIESQEWNYYIAAEEIIWDYGPNLPDNVDRNFRSTYLKQGADRIGKKYKKAVFTQYKDESFKERAEQKQRKKELGILGPVIRAQIRDKIKIVFKNKASRPYSIYPHGLTIDKAAEGANYPEGGNQSHAVQPGETYTYVWKVIEEDEPLNSDSRCLTRMYHSAVNTPRDIASGLVGPLLICKSQSLSTRNVQLRADKEQHAMFTIFDENKSWYLNENIFTYCGDPKNVKPDDPEFYKSNVMHTINGYVYESGQILGFCNGEIATWHVSSVGEQDDIQTATFYGHTFELNNREEDILSLFPMTGETISMNMANIGVWLMASLSTHETQKGLRVKFQDVECFRDYIMEYLSNVKDDEKDNIYEVWKPTTVKELENEKHIPPQRKTVVDEESDDYAALLGLRTLNNSGANYMEFLDLSRLDNDGVLWDTDKIQNTTHLGFEFDNNLTTEALQNESTTESLIKFSPELTPANSITNGTDSITTNPTAISLLQNIDSEITSEDRHNTSELTEEIRPLLSTQTSNTHKEKVAEAETLKFSGLSSVEVVNDDYMSKDNILIYSVPALNSHITITDTEDMKKFVLLDNGEETDANSHKHLVEYSVSPTELPNKTILELLGNATQTTWLGDAQELNHTNMNFESLYDISQGNPKVVSDFTLKVSQELNGTQVDFDFSVEEDKKFNGTQVDFEFSVEEDKKFNGTQVDFEFSVEEDKKFNGTQVDFEFSVEEDKKLNGTQVDFEFSVEEDKKFNGTQVDFEFSVEEDKKFNGTQVDFEFSVEEDKKLNSTQVDATFSLKEDKELNSTQVDFEFSVEEDKKLNGTQVDFKFSVEEDKKFNGTQVDFEFSDSEFSVQENIRHKDIEITWEKFRHLTSIQDHLYSDVQKSNSTKLSSKISNMLYDSFFESERTERTNLPQNVTFPTIVPFTDYAHNETMSPKVSNFWTSSEEFSSESLKNTSFSNCILNLSSTESNSSHTNIQLPNSSSERVAEVAIYLKDSKNTMVILTTPLDMQTKNWSYDGKHELVPVEFPDHMNKYITDKQPNSAKEDKEEKKNTYLKRVTPMKGYGMKTKKRKEYKPQISNGISQRGFSPRGFSPRGFAPSQLTPRTTKPISEEEDMSLKDIVIGVPRNDFSGYDIYVHYEEQDFDVENIPDDNGEYEYVEYKDPYGKPAQTEADVLDEVTKYSLQMAGKKSRVYFITAEEVNWDYAGYGHRREDKSSVKERPTLFKKVLFRSYLDSSFTTPDSRGEADEHLGIMGPVIKAEVGETIYVVFKNLASRPYSLHANGVSYSKNMEGLNYEDGSPYWYKYDDAVQPNKTFTYIWTVNDKVGPLNGDSGCRIWAYYSGINPERDIHSGLIGPLLVCSNGTLSKNLVDRQDFILLFMMFDENKSWYYKENWEILKKTNKRATMDPNFDNNIKFYAINGIVYSLKGLRMYANRLVHWHLINMGSPKDFHSIHFHGQTFVKKHNDPHRQGVFPLLPGGFATLEMWPSKPGLWMLESEVGIAQQRGMQTLFLVLDNECDHQLGLISGAVKDSQITASDSRDYWLPNLARLHNTGKYNAWSTTKLNQWIQVDFQRPVVISKIATQGAKRLFTSHYVLNYTIFYSTDRKRWSWYKGDSKTSKKTFEGNRGAHEVKENIFFPPIISRYVRLYPSHSYNYPTVRMEFFGCELDGCSVPLGMQSGYINDHQITASSVATNWYSSSWQPWFARLDKQGSLNAWQAMSYDTKPWLQIALKDVKKITGIVTQGAKSLNTEMFVTTYVLEYSDDGKKWIKYSDNEDYEMKIFMGNSDNNGHVKNYIYPPIFSKYIRILPTKWQNSATMRIELLGCDF